jgi:putative endonuclease
MKERGSSQGRPRLASGAGEGVGESTTAAGRRGEDAAAAHLERLGYVVIARNYRCRGGEIDVVARDGETIVFAEVKLRRLGHDGFEAVDDRKVRRLSRAALDFLSHYAILGSAARFDVVAVDAATMKCRHLVDAFELAL